jgi:hypothetical protein
LSAFQALPPLLVEPQPFLLEIVRSLQAQLERHGLQRDHDLLRDQLVKLLARQGLATRYIDIVLAG